MRGCSGYNTIKERLTEEISEWILSHPNIKPSCLSRNFVTVLNQESNIKEVFQNILIDISFRYLHNDMIKPSENGWLASVVDYVTQKVLIIYTILR